MSDGVQIVEALDEGEHCASRLGLRLEPAALEQFAFEGREEALAHGVVIGIADRTHRGSHTGLTTAVAELDRGALFCTTMTAMGMSALPPTWSRWKWELIMKSIFDGS